MLIETLSTFPDMFSSVMGASMMRLAQEKGILEFKAHDLRDWTHDRHRTTDDYPYGGGCGLIMKCEPIFEAMVDISPSAGALSEPSAGALSEPSTDTLPEASLSSPADSTPETRVVFLAPHGKLFNDEYASDLARADRIVFVCGHYEGIDERAYSLATDIISLGDYVLTSGELASMVVIDAVVRKLPGVLGAQNGAENESFTHGLLEYPQYTRPANFREMEVPEVLISGHHANIAKWCREQSLARTAKLRLDLLRAAHAKNLLNEADIEYLEKLGFEL